VVDDQEPASILVLAGRPTRPRRRPGLSLGGRRLPPVGHLDPDRLRRSRDGEMDDAALPGRRVPDRGRHIFRGDELGLGGKRMAVQEGPDEGARGWHH
jgi:hypothetical protein